MRNSSLKLQTTFCRSPTRIRQYFPQSRLGLTHVIENMEDTFISYFDEKSIEGEFCFDYSNCVFQLVSMWQQFEK